MEYKAKKGFIGIIDENTSYGTPMEMVYAHFHRLEQEKAGEDYEVIAVVLNGRENHHWIKYHCTKILTSLDDLESYLVSNKA